jgi:membrane protease YdiL (CAAX protease family)
MKETLNTSLIPFFLLTFLLSLPFYILSVLAYLNVVGKPEMSALYIALFTVAPIASASFLTYRRRGNHGLKELVMRIFDFKRIANNQWYLAILLLSPLIFLLSLAWIVFLGMPIPPAMTPFLALPAVFLVFFLMAAGEEVGWMGYAFDSMQARSSSLRAALLLGIIWALWHVPFFVFMITDSFVFIVMVIRIMVFRVLIVWIFNNTGKSVFAATLFHAVDNTALVIFPEIGAIEPWGSAMSCGLVIVAAVVATLLWGPRSLAQYRFAVEHHPEELK